MFEVLDDIDDAKKPKRDVDRFFIHCSASDNEGKMYQGKNLAKTIDRWHKNRGWSGIGYHFVIDKQGFIISGRSLEKTPAAQFGHNIATIAVCLHGLKEEKFTEEQIDSLVALCQHYDNLYNGQITFHGHKEVAKKACPVIDYKKILKLDSYGNLGEA